MRTDKLSRISDKAEYGFLILFFIYSFLHYNSFTYGHRVISCVMWVTFFLGGLLVLGRLIQYRSYRKTPGLLFLLLLLISLGISILANVRYAFKDNVVYGIYWVFYFFLLYMQPEDLSPKDYKKKFHLTAILFTGYMTAAVIASFALMLTGYNGVFRNPETNFEYRIGFSIGRLWGVFLNPNGAAFAAAAAAMLLLYFLFRTKKIVLRVLCAADVFLMLFYIALSDSRSGAICFGTMLGAFSFLLLWYRNRGKHWGRIGLSVMFAVILLIVGVYTPRLMKDAYNRILLAVATEGEAVPGESDATEFLVERGYDLDKDISNRRFDIWKSSLEIYTSSPKTMLVGTSFRGIVPYAREHLPDTYIIHNDHAIFQTMENEILNVLTAQGALGLLALISTAAFFAVYIFKRVFRLSPEYQLPGALFLSLVMGLGLCCAFSAVIFYHFSQSTLLFWFALGGLIFVLRQGKESVHEESTH